MPESTPAPNRWISRSGQAVRTWFQRVILPCASGAHSVFSSATVIDVAQVFFGFTTIGEAVVGDRQLDELDARLLAGLDLGWRGSVARRR